MKKTITSLTLLACAYFGMAQNPTLTWAKQLGGTGTDVSSSITTDGSGNVYTTGRFSGTLDIDPGTSVSNVNSAGANDIFISKVDASGNFVWGKTIGGTNDDAAFDIAVEGTGNVYVTGSFYGTADFNPGTGVTSLTSNGTYDIFILKLDASGNFVWANSVGGTGADEGFSIDVDAAGNVYTAGYFNATADFEPGPGITNLTSAGVSDAFVLKLNSSGTYQWSKQLGSVGADQANSIAVSSIGNSYIGGSFYGTLPAGQLGSMSVSSFGSYDGFILTLTPSGAINSSGALVGSTQDDAINAVALNESNDAIYFTGHFSGNVGAPWNYTNLGSAGTYDLFLQKMTLDPTTKAPMGIDWGFATGWTGNQEGMGLDVDPSNGNVIMSGYVSNTFIDFDPSTNNAFVSATGSSQDGFIAGYDQTGGFLFAFGIGNANYDNIYAVKAQNSNVYATGLFQGTEDVDPIGTLNLTSVTAGSTFDAYALKFNACYAPTIPTNVTSPANQTICSSNTTTLSAAASGTVSWYATLTGGTLLGTGATFITPILTTNTTFFAEAFTCTNSSRVGVTINVNSAPSVIANTTSTSICTGNSITLTGSGATTYTWSNGITDGTAFSPTLTASYIVTGTDASGCTNTANMTVTVNINPSIIVNSGAICSGNTFTITPSGASTYTIQGGNNVVSPTSTSSYTVIGTSIDGCLSSNTVTSSVTVNALPTVSVNSGAICFGKSFTITPTGALTYTVQGGSNVVSPTLNSTYTVAGTSAAGCASTNTATSLITVNALPTVSVNSGAICFGKSFTITPTGALTYTVQGGNNVVSPTLNTTYTVAGTSADGCASTNTATSSVAVNALPTVFASSNNTLLCAGQTVSLTASGAISYVWNITASTPVISVSPSTTTSYTVIGTNASGCTNTAVVTQSVSTCTGIANLSSNTSDALFIVYPNPTNGVLNVELLVFNNESYKIELLNALGQILISEIATTKNFTLKTETLTGGVYFLKATNTGFYKTIRIIKN